MAHFVSRRGLPMAHYYFGLQLWCLQYLSPATFCHLSEGGLLGKYADADTVVHGMHVRVRL